jgi:uncharacterized membrane protein
MSSQIHASPALPHINSTKRISIKRLLRRYYVNLICIVILLWEFRIVANHLIVGLSAERDLIF